MEELKRIVERLRAPDGCPWDRKQTNESLIPALLEETYEVAEAITNRDDENLREELGDLLLHVVMHAVIAEESGRFTLSAVEEEICEKLVRRHPHVFGEENVSNADEVIAIWEKVKAGEKNGKSNGNNTSDSSLDGVPQAMPALMRAQKIQKRASKAGFDWPDVGGALEKIEEELAEVRGEIDRPVTSEIENERVADELGDLLFAVVNVIRHQKLDAEWTLQRATQRFEERYRLMEKLAAEAGEKDFARLDLETKEQYWQRAKDKLAQPS